MEKCPSCGKYQQVRDWITVTGTVIEENKGGVKFKNELGVETYIYSSDVFVIDPASICVSQKSYKRVLQEQDDGWLGFRKYARREIRQTVEDDIQMFVDQRKQGEQDGNEITDDDKLAGWLIQLGDDCPDKQYDGLLVPYNGGKVDYDLMPPFDGCREETCTCQINAVNVADAAGKEEMKK
jgi:hypothetical protein